jgi:hypothetical protein
MGAAGLPGTRGAAGVAGAAGSQGPQGPKGPAGITEAGDNPILVDSTGKFVASAVYLYYMQIGSDFVSADIIPSGLDVPSGFFQDDAGGFTFYHAAANCAGPRLMLSYDPFIAPMTVQNNIGYYAGAPLTAITVQSVENIASGQDITQPSANCSTSDLPTSPLARYGPVKTVNINSLGLVPPFYFALE